jgi:hypothetical protein
MIADPNGCFAAQMLAIADALRHLREQVRFLERAGAVPTFDADARFVIDHGVRMAVALESLALRFVPTVTE